jgi:hypothetical protein
MLLGSLSEATSGKWKVVDMRGKTMNMFLDHLYSGSVNVIEADIGVFSELLNASEKVKTITLTSILSYTKF